MSFQLWRFASLVSCVGSDTGLEPIHTDSEALPSDSAAASPPDYYLNSVSALYALHPGTWETEQLGSFSVPFMMDTALTANGELFATEGSALIEVDRGTAELAWLYSIGSTSAMAGLADGRLVTAGVNGVFSLDPATGESSLLAPANGYGEVGDLAVLDDGTVYWVSSTMDGPFMLLRLDPADAAMIPVGELAVDEALGLLNVGGRLIGLAGNGAVFEIDPPTATVTLLAEQSVRWAGAASAPPRSE